MKKIFAVFMLTMAGVSGAMADNVFYAADSPEIRYVGRTEKHNDGTVSFDWAGTYFTTTVSSTRNIYLRISDSGESYYNIFVDDARTGVIHVVSDTLLRIASDLSLSSHSLRIQKRSEGEFGMATVSGIELDKGGRLSPSAPKIRHMEFIGNSITCGYGIEGENKNAPFLVSTENCDLSYACIIARYFDADYTLIAHSGRGAARNYGDSSRVSSETMAVRMMRTFDMDPDTEWNFKEGYRPDIVVINLGSNDFSTKPHPTKEQFTEAYRTILSQIRAGYGDIPVLCVSPRVGEPALSYISELCRLSDDPNVYFGGSMNGIYNNTTDLGAASHPNYKGSMKMAMMLIPRISTIMGWDMTGPAMIR